MIQLLYEPEFLSLEAPRTDRTMRPGVAFVPCAVCCAPVDLARLGDDEEWPLCDAHVRPVLLACAHG